MNALQNYVLRLRRALAATEGLRIATVPGGYRLEAAAGRVDADRAEHLVAESRAASASGDPGGAARALRTAIGLWRGPSLGEFADRPFAEAEARRLDELRESAREDLVDLELASGGHRRVCGDLQVMVARAPLRERRWAQLMLALYRDGRQADALDAFRTCRAALAGELGIAPGPDLNDLHARILRHDPALLAVPVPRRRRAGHATFVGRESELRRLLDRARGGGDRVRRARDRRRRTRYRQVPAPAGVRRRGRAARRGGPARAVRRGRVAAGVPRVRGGGHRAPRALPPARATSTAVPYADNSPACHRIWRPASAAGSGPQEHPRLQPDEERMWLIDGVARFVGGLAEEAPVVLVLDDLHWADASTLVLLRHLARVVADRRVLIVAAYRSDEIGPGLLDVLGALRTDLDVSSVPLRGLDLAALTALLDGVAAAPVSPTLASVILAETRGNPFFAREVIRHLAEEGALCAAADGRLETDAFPGVVPDGVRQVLARRRARLPAHCDPLMGYAAAFDGPFPFAAVTDAAGLCRGRRARRGRRGPRRRAGGARRGARAVPVQPRPDPARGPERPEPVPKAADAPAARRGTRRRARRLVRRDRRRDRRAVPRQP